MVSVLSGHLWPSLHSVPESNDQCRSSLWGQYLRLLADAQVGLHQAVAHGLLDGILHLRTCLERLALHPTGAANQPAANQPEHKTMCYGSEHIQPTPCTTYGLAIEDDLTAAGDDEDSQGRES